MDKRKMLIIIPAVLVIGLASFWVNKTYFSDDSPQKIGDKFNVLSLNNKGSGPDENLSFSSFNGTMTLKTLNATKGDVINLTCNSKIADGNAKIYMLDSNDNVVWESTTNGTVKKQINVSTTQKYSLRLSGSASNGSEAIKIKSSGNVDIEDKNFWDNN